MRPKFVILTGLLSLAMSSTAYASQWFYVTGTGNDPNPAISLADAQDQAHNNLENLCNIWKGEISKEETTARLCNTYDGNTFCQVSMKGFCDY